MHASLHRSPHSRFNRATTIAVALLLAACSTATPTETGGTVAAPAQTSASAASTAPTVATTDPAPDPVVSQLPPVVAPLTLVGDADAQAAALADALEAAGSDRAPAVLAAFAGTGVPVLLADGTSLTPASGPVGLPWSIVSSVTALPGSSARVSLGSIAGMFALANLGYTLDAATAAQQLVDGLRVALASGSGQASFLAHLVAEEARRTNGTELGDPAATADIVFVSPLTAMVLTAVAMRASVDAIGAASSDVPTTVAAESGPRRGVHLDRSADEPTLGSSGCDDGLGGWGLWVGSKIAAGVGVLPTLGVEWKGIYEAVAQLAVARGALDGSVLQLTATAAKAAGVVGAFINLILLEQQLVGREAHATIDGSGPLVRTKTTSNGESRMITLTVVDNAGDPELVAVRNCILAALALTGNNAQQPNGAAAHIQIDTVGGLGFTTNLDTSGTIVLFGPTTFQPTQTADDSGTILIPVQGRGQRTDKSDATATVDKTFSVWFDASLDPLEVSQLGRAAADDALCAGTALAGDGLATFSECQNAIVDIVKQFRWHVGEFFFPLTDWTTSGWEASVFSAPYSISVVHCPSDGESWSFDLEGNLDGAQYNSTAIAEIDADSGVGTYSLDGQAVGGGITVHVTGLGDVRFVIDGPAAAHLEVSGFQYGPRDSGGNINGLVIIPLTPLDCPA